jgi:hypothetical protein
MVQTATNAVSALSFSSGTFDSRGRKFYGFTIRSSSRTPYRMSMVSVLCSLPAAIVIGALTSVSRAGRWLVRTPRWRESGSEILYIFPQRTVMAGRACTLPELDRELRHWVLLACFCQKENGMGISDMAQKNFSTEAWNPATLRVKDLGQRLAGYI